MSIERAELEALLRRAFDAAVRAAAPERGVRDAVASCRDRGPALVLGAGKAAAAMAVAFADAWGAPTRGCVVTRYGHGLRAGEHAGGIDVLEAGHPSPDEVSLAAGARLLQLARGVAPEERVVCLISGGGSALASAPVEGLPFERKRAAADHLIRAGADIREINCVRKHLSNLKGGRLAQAARPARVLTLAISDVPGDDPADIASGPTVPDATTQRDALDILHGYGYAGIDGLRAVLESPRFETPKPGDAGFDGDDIRLIATASTAFDAAEALLRAEGFEVLRLGEDLADEAAPLGRTHARLALEQQRRGVPVAILSGGETRVVLGESAGDGRGGRNLEYLAGLALELRGAPGIHALAADTDGVDGRGDHAGGVVAPGMLEAAAARGASLEALLRRHDSYRFFEACGGLVKTGPTRTNVNDFRLIVCLPTDVEGKA